MLPYSQLPIFAPQQAGEVELEADREEEQRDAEVAHPRERLAPLEAQRVQHEAGHQEAGQRRQPEPRCDEAHHERDTDQDGIQVQARYPPPMRRS